MFNKIYLSRAQSRAYSYEFGVGDPTGGPAYGEQWREVEHIQESF